MPPWLILLALTRPGFAEPGEVPAEDAATPSETEGDAAEEEPAGDTATKEPRDPPADGEQAVEPTAPSEDSDEPPSTEEDPRPASPPEGDSASVKAPEGDSASVKTPEELKPKPATEPPAMAILRGKVLERGSGKPVAGARVVSGEHSAVVRPDGTFLLPLPPGRRAVIIQDEEHLEAAQVEELFPGDQLTVIYRVERWAWGREVVVYGDKVREEVSRTVLTAEELRLVPGSFGDPIRALQSLPGVARPTTVEGDLVVRGAEASNTATYIDLVPVPYLFHFFVGRSVVNPSLLDDVEFFPGGMPTRFGNVTQAIVNARTGEREIGLGVHGTVSVDLLDFSASAEARMNDHITWEAAIRESWIGGLVGLGTRTVAAARGNGTNVPGWAAPNYFDYAGRFTWAKEDDKVTIAIFGAQDAFVLHPPRDLANPEEEDELTLPFDPNKPLYSNFHRLHVRWDRQKDKWNQSTWFALGPETEGNLLAGIGMLADGPDVGELKAWTFMARRDDRVDLGTSVGALRLGAEGIARPVAVRDFDEAFTEDDVETTRDVVLSGGAWAEWQREWGTTWIGLGMRMSAHQFNRRFAPSGEPRLTIRQPVSDHWTLTGFAGRFSQVPAADRYAEGIGNPELKLITAWQTSVGVEGRWPSGVEVNVTAYATWMENLVVKDQVVVLRREDDTVYTGISSEFTPVRGRSYGLDTLLRVRPNNGWFGWAAVSLSRAQRIDEDGVFAGSFDQPIAVTLVGARELPKDWRISARMRFTSGQPYTPLYGVYSADTDYWSAIEGERNSERFPPFRQFDFRVDHTWTAEKARWTLYLDVFNAFNHQNFFLATYDPTYQQLEPQVWMPIMPTLGLEVAY
ncbi:MAG: TonB-dependent receptor plug domain-containing protein [Proteobacteria bacterium]|nr:TonB-dependent receptor plug domain-containing protein [Pseudomonadota bacterium]